MQAISTTYSTEENEHTTHSGLGLRVPSRYTWISSSCGQWSGTYMADNIPLSSYRTVREVVTKMAFTYTPSAILAIFFESTMATFSWTTWTYTSSTKSTSYKDLLLFRVNFNLLKFKPFRNPDTATVFLRSFRLPAVLDTNGPDNKWHRLTDKKPL